MKRYDKLVRDGIPAIIERSGRRCVVRVLGAQEYVERLDQKLQEELNEYLVDGSIEELADLVEVIRAAAIARGSTWEALEAVRIKKLHERGGFAKRWLLVESE